MPDSSVQRVLNKGGCKLKVVEYVTSLGRDGRRRTRHVRVKNNIIEFIVQAEKDLRDNWQKYREQYLKEIEKND